MSLSSKIIPGSAHNQNRGACHWGSQGLIAYGCQQYVVVVDHVSLQTVQVVNKHSSNVVCVQWNNEDFHHDIVHPYSLTLATGDAGGVVCTWNVVTGETKMEFKEKGKAVRDICWLNNKDTGDAAILVLYSGGTFALWDCTSTSQLWRTTFSENMTTISIDPFKATTAAFLADDSVVIINDLQWKSAPDKQATKITFSGKNTGSAQIKRNSTSSLKQLIGLTTTLTRPSRKSSTDDQIAATQCLHIAYHPAIRHWLLMVFPDHVDIVDIEVSMVIGAIRLDQNASAFVKVIPCQQRDALICLHENSSISIRLRREDTSHCSHDMDAIPLSPVSPESPLDPSAPHLVRDITYDLLWQSDTMRLTSNSTVFGYDVHPVSECKTCLVCNDGKIVIWELVSLKPPSHSHISPPYLSLSDFVPIAARRGTRSHITKHTKFLQTGVCGGSSYTITAVRSNTIDSVAVTKGILGDEDNLLAVGTEDGSIQMIDLKSGQIEKQFNVHFDIVRGIEWVNQSQLLSWAHQSNPTSSNQGRNEIFLLNLKSGEAEKFRDHATVESLIHIIKISPLRQYVIISFKDKPVEIWSLKTKSLIRELPLSTIQPRAIVWSTLSKWRTVKKHLDLHLSRLNSTDENEESMKKMTLDEISSLLKNIKLKKIAQEHCLIADKDGMICRFTLEDRSITDIVTYQNEVNGMTTLTHMTMKSDSLILVDANGMLSILNLADKKVKSIPKSSDKSVLSIKKIAFHPISTDERFYVLHEAGVDLWIFANDKVKRLGGLRTSKDLKKIVDIEWADSTHVALVTQDGAIHVRDLTQSNVRHAMNSRILKEPIFCPQAMSSRGMPLMKHALLHPASLNGVRLLPDQRQLEDAINKQILLIDSETLAFLRSEKSSMTAKSLVISRLFGDEFDIKFWNLAANSISHWKCQKENTEDNMLLSLDSASGELGIPGMDKKSASPQRCTGTQYDVLMNHSCFWNHQLHRHRIHDKKRTTAEHRAVCVDNYILLGQLEDAVRLLLETNFQDDGYREDYLRACLLSCARGNTTGQSILKLVATHLIINGKLEEGVGVIRMMGKTLDGCKYLQSYGAWEKAAWLAKAVLNREECSEVVDKWIDNLVQSKNMVEAVFVMLSEGRFYDVAKTLLHIGYLDTAACFVEACNEVGIDLKQQDGDNTIRDFLPTYEKHLERLGLDSIA